MKATVDLGINKVLQFTGENVLLGVTLLFLLTYQHGPASPPGGSLTAGTGSWAEKDAECQFCGIKLCY